MNKTLPVFLCKGISSWDDIKAPVLHAADSPSPVKEHVAGLKGSLVSFFVQAYLSRVDVNITHALQYSEKMPEASRTVLLVAPDMHEALSLQSDLSTLFRAQGKEADILVFPQFTDVPYRPVSKGSVTFGKRAASLAKLSTRKADSSRPLIIISTERALLQPLPPPDHIKGNSFWIQKDKSIDPQKTAEKLSEMGYYRVPKVSVRGEFALRGEVLDIFLSGEDQPCRIQFDFDTVEAIRTFDIETQLTITPLKELLVYPNKEVLWNDELVKKLEEILQKEDREGIKNDYARFDAERKGLSTSELYGNSSDPAKSEETPALLKHLSFTDAAKEHMQNALTELIVKKETEGEELYYGILWGKKNTLLDYLPRGSAVICSDYDRMCNAQRLLQNEYDFSYRKARLTKAVLPPQSMLLDFETEMQKSQRLVCLRSIETEEEQGTASFTVRSQSALSYFNNLNYFKEQLESLQKDGWSVIIFAGSDTQVLRIRELIKNFTEPEDKSLKPVEVIPVTLSEGFSIPDKKIAVIQNDEIFRRTNARQKALKKGTSTKQIESFIELSPGDFVVHKNYGIGKFLGIERVKSTGTERDYIKLEYAGQEFAFVPIEQVNFVQRYIGKEGTKAPALDTIGSKNWNARKAKVQQQVEELAEKLVDLYSKRKASRGYAFPKDSEWQTAFEAAFPYEDTEDQYTVTQEIKADMEKPVPMDRLVCGDVGYGKTELAMRAAFKAVMGGKQVAFLAPTTILAEQHFETCTERFRNFPVRVAQLSRFVSPAEQKKTLAALKEGSVDVLIGTHRIIQKDVIFKDLGLLIIDEEQRFGVKDKEKLKALKTNIDCLAMSATPIPRTLHMSMLKIRDMSLLTTPPQNRRPVETFVEEYNSDKVAEAIRAEAERGGQVFYLHNRVESLEETRIKIQKLVPELMVEAAHGQMTSDELDDIFRRFKMGGFHVLVSTTIIENGVDIPSVNTIIIDRADLYGVSQLYQLRGRVGRSDRTAFAYLFYPKDRALSEEAMKRLQVISDFTELGSGFKIALKDMEIRGAGNLLGRDQSGNVYSVGFEMYISLLNMAIERLMRSDWQSPNEVLLELEYSGFIPDSYIHTPQIKMEVYKRIAGIQTDEALAALENELSDRFGPVPAEVKSLLTLAGIRILCNKLSISSIKEKRGILTVTFAKDAKVNIEKVLAMLKSSAGSIRLDAQHPDTMLIKTGSLELADKGQFITEKLEQLL